jgi:hypothetical protein
MKGDEVGGVYSMHGRDGKYINFVGKYDRKRSLGEKVTDWLIY